MSACLSFSQIVEIEKPRIEGLRKVAEQYPDPAAAVACEAFSKQVKVVEGLITNTYTVAVTLARRASDLQEVSDTWRRMGDLCDDALQALSALKGKYSYCGTPELYDLVLDYKLACDERRIEAEEEISCQSRPTPAGLLPDKN